MVASPVWLGLKLRVYFAKHITYNELPGLLSILCVSAKPYSYIYLWDQPCCPMCIFMSLALQIIIYKHNESVVLTAIYWDSSTRTRHIPCNRNGVLLVFGSCFTPSWVRSFSQSIRLMHHAFRAAFQWTHQHSSSRPVLQQERGQIIAIIIMSLVKVWVAHALGMPETFSSPPRASDPDMQSQHVRDTRAMMHAGIAN